MAGFAFAERFCRRPATIALTGTLLVCGTPLAAGAASLAPPMLDITHQCDNATRHNMRAMSECVVAESEARAEILQKWDRVSDANAQRCVAVGRKSRRLPYSAIAKCLTVEPVVLPTAPVATVPAATVPVAPATPAPTTADKETGFSSWKKFFSSGK